MNSEYCPVGSVAGGWESGKKCGEPCKNGIYMLKDRKGMKFPVMCDKIDCRSTILNSNVLFMADSLENSHSWGIDNIRLDITDESPDDVKNLVDMHRLGCINSKEMTERYHAMIDRIKASGFTRGHYFRGV